MKFLQCLVVLLALVATPAIAGKWEQVESLEDLPDDIDTITSSVPIYSQKIEFNIPKGWKPGFENVKGGHYIMEFVLKDETVQNWNQMFTVQGYKGLTSLATPKQFLAKMGDVHKQVCGDNAIYELVEEDDISGHEAQGAIIGCTAVAKDHPSGLKKGNGEVAYYIAVKGKEDIYMFHKAIRQKEFTHETSPVTKENAKDFISDFMPIRLCKKGSKIDECIQ